MMPTSALHSRLRGALVSFAWDEWAQMGLLAEPRHQSPWAQDPEALLVFTLEVARDEPRLFDETLDWLATNSRLVSRRRLRAVCVDDEDRRLVTAAMLWATGKVGRPDPEPETEAVALFRGLSSAVRDPDEAFQAYGFLRPKTPSSGKSSRPNLRAPINLAFRLRELLGLSARAEVVRCLLTIDVPRVSGSVLVRAAAYAKPNVYEAASALRNAGVVTAVMVGNEQRFAADRERWAGLLGEPLDWAPAQRDWPQLLGALRRILRWLEQTDTDEMSEYLRGSLTRDLLEEVAPDLSLAGVVVDYGEVVQDPWGALTRTVDRSLQALVPTGPTRRAPEASELLSARRRAASTIEVFPDSVGAHGWRLKAANGQIVAMSGETYHSQRSALDAARKFRAPASDLSFEVSEENGGRFGWHARSASGRVIARSAESFTSRTNAQRAAKRMRDVAKDAGRDDSPR
jgi:uncharacterized protein YegP (UPF0339 family)